MMLHAACVGLLLALECVGVPSNRNVHSRAKEREKRSESCSKVKITCRLNLRLQQSCHHSMIKPAVNGTEYGSSISNIGT